MENQIFAVATQFLTGLHLIIATEYIKECRTILMTPCNQESEEFQSCNMHVRNARVLFYLHV